MNPGDRYRWRGRQPDRHPDLIVAEVHDDEPRVDWTNDPTCVVRSVKGRTGQAWTQSRLEELYECVEHGAGSLL